MSTLSGLSTVVNKSFTSAPSSTTVLPGCEETYLSSIFDTYCTPEVANPPPTCTIDNAPCCSSQINYASSIYACVASHAGNCATISDYLPGYASALQECTSLTVTGSDSATAGPTLSVTKSSTPAKTTSAPTSTGTGTQSVAAQSSAAATTSKSGAVLKADGGLRTMGVLGLVGGLAMWFLGGGL